MEFLRFRRAIVATIVMGSLLMLSRGVSYAESMTFVDSDADDEMGYYVDTDSISRTSYQDKDGVHNYVRARVAVVRADLDRRYIYAMQFEPAKMTYQIFASQEQVYGTKEIIKSNDTAYPPLPYTATSKMKKIVDFIESLPKN